MIPHWFPSLSIPKHYAAAFKREKLQYPIVYRAARQRKDACGGVLVRARLKRIVFNGWYAAGFVHYLQFSVLLMRNMTMYSVAAVVKTAVCC